jgi:hypothetical protein
MRKNDWLGLLAFLALPAAPAVAGGVACPHFARTYARLADLPPGAVAALGFPIAERGGRWNVGDAVGPGPLLPFARFIAAEGGGCTLNVRYEYGGIAHGFATAVLQRSGHGWTLLRRR